MALGRMKRNVIGERPRHQDPNEYEPKNNSHDSEQSPMHHKTRGNFPYCKSPAEQKAEHKNFSQDYNVSIQTKQHPLKDQDGGDCKVQTDSGQIDAAPTNSSGLFLGLTHFCSFCAHIGAESIRVGWSKSFRKNAFRDPRGFFLCGWVLGWPFARTGAERAVTNG